MPPESRSKCRACVSIETTNVTGDHSARKRCKQMDIGGVSYEIWTYEFGSLYRAEWLCQECREAGAWAPISATPDQAVKLAQIGLRIHHSLVHGEPLRTTR
jgi:hypothetical protein